MGRRPSGTIGPLTKVSPSVCVCVYVYLFIIIRKKGALWVCVVPKVDAGEMHRVLAIMSSRSAAEWLIRIIIFETSGTDSARCERSTDSAAAAAWVGIGDK